MHLLWSKNNKIIASPPVSLIDDSETDDSTNYTDLSDCENLLSLSDTSYDYQIPEDAVSCTSLADECKILCAASVDNSNVYFDQDDVLRKLNSTKGTSISKFGTKKFVISDCIQRHSAN